MNENARVLLIGASIPEPNLGGGARRTYQLLHELRARFGEQGVALLRRSELVPDEPSFLKRLRRTASRAITRAYDRLENPFQLFVSYGYGFSRHLGDAATRYRAALARLPNVKICIVEHAEFAPLSNLNASIGVRTFLAPWAIASMLLNLPYVVPALQAARRGIDDTRHRLQVRAAFTHFANELLIDAALDKSWFLSKVEAGLLSAVGIRSGYLPYYPVGEVADEAERIRVKRNRADIDDGLFVICGGNIDQNRLSLDAFLERLKDEDLPSGSRIEILGTDLRPAALTGPNRLNVTMRGYLPRDEFDRIIVRARAILVPQSCGFGCLTRVPDMLAAGIPVIADSMVANATGEIPGVHYAASRTGGWTDAFRRALQQEPILPNNSLEPWLDASRRIVSNELEELTG